MENPNPLSKLALDYWYQVLMVVCVIVFLLSGAGILKAFPVAPTAALSAGGFFIGLGEWINHPLQTSILHANAYRPGGIVTGHPRHNSFIGIVFVTFGILLIAFGSYLIVS
ncbi:MAG: hypothetical protein L6Q71_12025 [Planctomycetes bacterium]|jgi:hypothetical protein|nr:hypothetical protein [Planctomycetota bacterium]